MAHSNTSLPLRIVFKLFTVVLTLFAALLSTTESTAQPRKRASSGSSQANVSSAQTSKLNCDALAGHPDDKKRVGSGVADEKIQPAKAIPKCTLAISESPDEARFHFQLGRAYWAAKRYDEALESFLKAEEMSYSPAYFYIGQAYEKGLIAGEKAEPATARNFYLLGAAEEFAPAVRAYQELAGTEPEFSEFKQPNLLKALYDGDLDAFNKNRVEAIGYAVGLENFMTIPDSEYDKTCQQFVDSQSNDRLRVMLYVDVFGLTPDAVHWSDERLGFAMLPKVFTGEFNNLLKRFRNFSEDGTNDMYLLAYDYGTCEGDAVKKVYSSFKRFVKEKY